MKRHNSDLNPYYSSSAGPSKATMKSVQENTTNNMDELLAVLGYNVRSTDINDVADKLEQLEEIMGTVKINGFSPIALDSVHYNPSDLSNWVQTLLAELHAPLPACSPHAPSHRINKDNDPFLASSSNNTLSFDESSACSDYDLTAITGKAVLLCNNDNSNNNKRLRRTASSSESTRTVEPSLHSLSPQPKPQRPVVLVDSQDNGVRLVHTLMACAEAVQQTQLVLAETLVKQVGFLAVQQTGAMRKVATYFAEALARRIYGVRPQNPLENCLVEMLQMHFYETCPYLKFAHFTANQAILEAFQGKQRVHIVDFGINQGVQWPALLQALALQPGGPPRVRLTGIGPPAPDGSDHLQETGWKLAQLAETVNIEFEYRGFVATNLADLDDVNVLNLRDDEAVAVNSVFELHKLLARPGSMEKLLHVVKETKPVIVTIVEQESNHNGPDFLDRFTEALHYYCSMFDSLEGAVPCHDKVMTEVYLGKQICNVVACEGSDRIERFENLTQWRNRLGLAGFLPVHLGSNAYKQASMLLALFEGGQGYKVEENNGCLMLGWHTRPLITTSAWRIDELQQSAVY